MLGPTYRSHIFFHLTQKNKQLQRFQKKKGQGDENLLGVIKKDVELWSSCTRKHSSYFIAQIEINGVLKFDDSFTTIVFNEWVENEEVVLTVLTKRSISESGLLPVLNTKLA